MLLGVLALTQLLSRDYWRAPHIPRIALLPVALIAVVLLQSALGMMAYAGQSLLYILYLLFAALMMLLGGRLRDCFGIEKLAIILSACLLLGAQLNALIGVLQHYVWHTFLDSVVVKSSSSIYGNLAQANHFANYIALGLISLGFLFQQRKIPVIYVIALAIPLLFVMTLSGSRSSWLYLLMMCGLAWLGGRELRPLLRYSLILLLGFTLMQWMVQLSFFHGHNTLQRFSGAGAAGGIRLYLWRESWLIFTQSPWLGAGFGQFSWQHFQLGPLLHRINMTGLYNNAHNLIFQLAAEAGVAGLLALCATLGAWVYCLRSVPLNGARWWGYAVLSVLAIHSLLEYPLWYAYFLAIAAFLLGALDETRYCMRLSNMGRVMMSIILLWGFGLLFQLQSGYQQLKTVLVISKALGPVAESLNRSRDTLAVMHAVPLLMPYSELLMSALVTVNADQLAEKLALNTRVLHFMPTGAGGYRQALLLAQSGQLEQAKKMWEQTIWSYPDDAAEKKQLLKLTEKDSALFAALLEFALESEQE